MNNPKDILDSWIMIEHLDEGAISLDNRKSTFSNINCSTNNNYYDYFKKTIENNILRKAKNKKMEEKNEDGDKDKDEKSDKEKDEGISE